jgi:hypothetical protein
MSAPAQQENELQREMRLADAAEEEQRRQDWIAVQELVAKQQKARVEVEEGVAVAPVSKSDEGDGDGDDDDDDDDDSDVDAKSAASLPVTAGLVARFAKEWKKMGTHDEREGFLESEPKVRSYRHRMRSLFYLFFFTRNAKIVARRGAYVSGATPSSARRAPRITSRVLGWTPIGLGGYNAP